MWQLCFRWGYRVLLLWWRLRRPRHRGALVALWHDGKVLLLRTSYRRIWNLPGGGLHRGEGPLAGALREMREEIGLVLPAAALRPALTLEVEWEHRRDHVTIFEAELPQAPLLVLDQREIVAAAFRAPDSVRADEVAPHIARYLRSRSALSG
jgi:8-oxo-dGTP diphosphatase